MSTPIALVPVATPTLALSATPSPTLKPQVLGRIFPPGFDSPGVWANINTGNDLGAMKMNIHFDVGLPDNFVPGKDALISPVSGTIALIYLPSDDPEGEGGKGMLIVPYPPLEGIGDLVDSTGYARSRVRQVYLGFGHLLPTRDIGPVVAGEPIALAKDLSPIPIRPNKVGYYIIVRFDDRKEYYFSPCALPNTAEFCGKCYPGTPYNCP